MLDHREGGQVHAVVNRNQLLPGTSATLAPSLGGPPTPRVQVISIIAHFKLAWPASVVSLMRALSWANFSFDLVKPECTVEVRAVAGGPRVALHMRAAQGFSWLTKYAISVIMLPVAAIAMAIAVFGWDAIRRWRALRVALALTSLAAVGGATPEESTVVVAPAAGRAGGVTSLADKLGPKETSKLLLVTLLKLLYLTVSYYSLCFYACTRVGVTAPVYIFDTDTSRLCVCAHAIVHSRCV